MEKRLATFVAANPAIAAIEREMMRLVRISEAFQRKRPLPLERAEYIILRTLAEEGPQGIGHLARQLLLDDSTMTRQIAVLEEKGLVHRGADPADGRASIVAATQTGLEKTVKTLEIRLTRTGQYTRAWSEEERRALGELLARFNAGLIDVLGE